MVLEDRACARARRGVLRLPALVLLVCAVERAAGSCSSTGPTCCASGQWCFEGGLLKPNTWCAHAVVTLLRQVPCQCFPSHADQHYGSTANRAMEAALSVDPSATPRTSVVHARSVPTALHATFHTDSATRTSARATAWSLVMAGPAAIRRSTLRRGTLSASLSRSLLHCLRRGCMYDFEEISGRAPLTSFRVYCHHLIEAVTQLSAGVGYSRFSAGSPSSYPPSVCARLWRLATSGGYFCRP